ncbi:hypothetical protein MYX84_00745 [Acidobacteria bacterium AH-259-O06]|nr:hypothetical protein [Acidobacteria bacterium AH-259-O06]
MQTDIVKVMQRAAEAMDNLILKGGHGLAGNVRVSHGLDAEGPGMRGEYRLGYLD